MEQFNDVLRIKVNEKTRRKKRMKEEKMGKSEEKVKWK